METKTTLFQKIALAVGSIVLAVFFCYWFCLLATYRREYLDFACLCAFCLVLVSLVLGVVRRKALASALTWLLQAGRVDIWRFVCSLWALLCLLLPFGLAWTFDHARSRFNLGADTDGFVLVLYPSLLSAGSSLLLAIIGFASSVPAVKETAWQNASVSTKAALIINAGVLAAFAAGIAYLKLR